MERRRFPRRDVSGLPLKATVVISGESLLEERTPKFVEIDAKPVNISRSGICLLINLGTPWNTFSPDKELDLFLQRGKTKQAFKGKIVHILEGGRMIGLEFCHTLNDMDSLLDSPGKSRTH